MSQPLPAAARLGSTGGQDPRLKRGREADLDDEYDSDFVESGGDGGEDWRRQLRSLTGYDPSKCVPLLRMRASTSASHVRLVFMHVSDLSRIPGLGVSCLHQFAVMFIPMGACIIARVLPGHHKICRNTLCPVLVSLPSRRPGSSAHALMQANLMPDADMCAQV